MFNRLLVPLDGSALAESVLPTTKYFAEKFGATVVLFHALEQGARSTVHGERHLLNVDEAETYLEDIAARFASPNLKIETDVHPVKEVDVARSIIEHIEELKGDLVVLCAHGGGRLRDLFVGNIAQQVVARGTSPVLFIHPRMENAPTFECRKILIPLDSTPHHEPALPIASEMARQCGSELNLLTVVPTTNTLSAERAGTGMLLPTTMTAVLDLAQRGAVEYLQSTAARLLADGIATTAQVMRGDPAAGVLQIAKSHRADLIVLATHGRTNAGAFWSGSVTPKILARAHIPVLLVRMLGEEAER
jgi:nucleotide-binding universal stress UspA family protein